MSADVPSPASAEGRQALAAFYREHLDRTLLPFWLERAVDTERGGVFTCFDNRGERLLSRDKYTWSQGRFVWMTARLARLAATGVVRGEVSTYLAPSRATFAFLQRYVLLEGKRCAYVLSEEGEPIESSPGAGFAPSLFADAFVVLGAAEHAAAEDQVGDSARAAAAAKWALDLYRPLARAMATGNVPSAPYPIPAGCTAHSFPMIMVNVSQTLGAALRRLGHMAAVELDADRARFVEQVMSYTEEDGAVREVRCDDGERGAVEGAGGDVPEDLSDTLLLRHANPGHALESMWFLLHESVPGQLDGVTARALKVIEHSLTIGWDEEHGGLLRFVAPGGGRPVGRNSGGAMDRLIHDTWSSKLWWPHSEALYASLLAYRLAGGAERLRWFERLHSYVFETFPNPDVHVGEWIQIRDRDGTPLEKVVALPVKDPFHVVRNVMSVLELLARWDSAVPCG